MQLEDCAVESILDVREMLSSPGRYELLISWLSPDMKASWESFDQMNKDVPDLVKDFFYKSQNQSRLNYDQVLHSEISVLRKLNYGASRGRGGGQGSSLRDYGGGSYTGGD
jgi:hypothetical protein